MPLELFRSRNFSASNLTTLCLYGAVPAATVFLILFLQQVRGASALVAGASLLPATIMIFLFAKRFGALADRIGARWLIGVGPLIAAVGLAWLLRLDAHDSYLAIVLPASTVLGLGLAIAVAPLTSTVMGSVSVDRDGVASGINNAVARVAGLVSVAGIGAVLAAKFSASVTGAYVRGGSAVAQAAMRPLSTDVSGFPVGQKARARLVLEHASVQGLHVALAISLGLAVIAGITSMVLIRDAKRPERIAVSPGGVICVTTDRPVAGLGASLPQGRT
jgi:Na+/melibiose symporter-like transporter